MRRQLTLDKSLVKNFFRAVGKPFDRNCTGSGLRLLSLAIHNSREFFYTLVSCQRFLPSELDLRPSQRLLQEAAANLRISLPRWPLVLQHQHRDIVGLLLVLCM